MNLRERISHTPSQSANKAAYSGFETHRRRHQKSATGVSVAPKKDMCPPKLKKKKFECHLDRPDHPATSERGALLALPFF